MKLFNHAVCFFMLFASVENSAETILPSPLLDTIKSAGYTLAGEASATIEMPNGSFVLRVYSDSSYERESIVSLRGGSLQVIESDRYAGDRMIIEPKDINSDGVTDLIISELFEVGGGLSEWSVRIYINDQGYKKAFDGESASKPKFVDFTGDGHLELIVTSDPYGFGYARSFCGMIYKLRDGKYYQLPKGANRAMGHPPGGDVFTSSG